MRPRKPERGTSCTVLHTSARLYFLYSILFVFVLAYPSHARIFHHFDDRDNVYEWEMCEHETQPSHC